MKNITVSLLALLVGFLPMKAHAKSEIVTTPHNLSVTGPGPVRALVETRICIFCHTPHNAAPQTPLWNKNIESNNYNLYTVYGSSTLEAAPLQPSGPSRLCLSCHDGTIALGKIRSSATEIMLNRQYVISDLTIDLSDDHPFSFNYYDSIANPEIQTSPSPDLLFYGNGNVECSTCHDAHDNSFDRFLRVNNAYSGLCLECHAMTGWKTSIWATAPFTWNGLGTNPWPRNEDPDLKLKWHTIPENACLNCHKPHTAGGPKRLLNYLQEEQNCYPCHNDNVQTPSIEGQFQKISHHPVEATTIGAGTAHDPTESPTMLSGHVECVDCHNPHAANTLSAVAPAASGSLNRVSGVDLNYISVETASYEYQVCFKCHADSNTVQPKVERVVNENNMRVEFDPANPSFHPVVDIGNNPDVPSIPSTYEPGMTSASMIYCTDCHDSDESRSIGGTGPRGPHGSIYSPILRQEYLTADNTPESFENYALCYRCHDRQKLLDDAITRFSTRSGGHAGHLGPAVNAPCSACHDPHGVSDDGFSGSHTHLINFDILISTPAPGETVPFFTDLGDRTGSCTLVCHGVTHLPDYSGVDPMFVNSSYP